MIPQLPYSLRVNPKILDHARSYTVMYGGAYSGSDNLC